VRALEDEGAARGATVRLALAGRTPSVAGHRDALVQVLVNLVKNGIEAATAPGGARPDSPEVVLAVAAGDGSVRFDVTDNGPGLAPEDAARVFEPFYSTKTAQGGTGLGLSMARDIIRAHGGTLTASSGSPGARFTVTLPAAT
jgi:two-component system sensor histidine kinase GlrK